MRIIVTGSAGFIGRVTVIRLEAAGHDVIAIDKNETDTITAGPRVTSHIKCDVTNISKLKNVFRSYEPNAIIHLAANSSLQRSINEPVYDALNNIIGTLNVIECAKMYNCQRLVFSSTSAVYGHSMDGPYHERMARDPICNYGISKATCEMYISICGIPYAILRYANVYGPGQKPVGDNILIARLLNHIFNGEPFAIYGDGEQVRDFIYVWDVAEANLVAVEDGKSCTWNISTGTGYSVNHVVSLIVHMTMHKGRIEHIDAKPGELRSVILMPSMAWRDLGWKAMTQLPDGLKTTIEEWRNKTR